MTLEHFKLYELDGIVDYLALKRSGDTALLARTVKGRIGADYYVALGHAEGTKAWQTLIPCASFDDAQSVYETEVAKCH